ncbi:MAG: hypothetical protein LC640_09185 [Frankia sp.]|nr:hypothetical protein [Frankia sp.]
MALADEVLADLKKRGSASSGGPPPKGAPPAPADDAGDDGGEYASDEEAAMQDFEDATTPADKVAALKAFMSICYPQLGSQGE